MSKYVSRSVRTIFVISVACFLLSLPVFALMDVTKGLSLIPGYAIGIAAMVLAAVWAGLGTQGYLLRTLIGFTAAVGVFLGLAGSFWIANSMAGISIEMPLVVVGFTGVTLTIAAQIPFLILFGFAGWYFEEGGQKTNSAFSIQTLFSVVFIFSIAFASSQFAKQRAINNAISDIVLGESTFVLVPIEQSSGPFMGQSFTVKEVDVTESNVKELKQNAATENGSDAALFSSIYTIVVGFLAIPLVWTVFRKPYLGSFGFCFLYSLGISTVVAIPVYAMGGATLTSMGMLYFGDGITCLLIWFFLVCLRLSGVKLHTRKDQNSKNVLQEQDVESVLPEMG